MKNEYEIIPNPQIKHIHCFVNDITYRNFHTHNNFELLLILDGKGIINVGNRSYNVKKADIILINPNEPHEINGRVICCILQISRQFCSTYFQQLKNTLFRTEHINPYLSNAEAYKLGSEIISATLNYVQRNNYFELLCTKTVLEILYIILQKIPHDTMSTSEYISYNKKVDRLNRISSFIDSNYQEPIRLETIAKSENLTVTYLSHFFKDCFGVTFQEYLNNKRFEQAMRLIPRKDLNLTQISDLCGFSDIKYLNKMFQKRLGVKPQQFRDNMDSVIKSDENTQQNILEYKYNEAESIRVLTDFLSAVC